MSSLIRTTGDLLSIRAIKVTDDIGGTPLTIHSQSVVIEATVHSLERPGSGAAVFFALIAVSNVKVINIELLTDVTAVHPASLVQDSVQKQSVLHDKFLLEVQKGSCSLFLRQPACAESINVAVKVHFEQPWGAVSKPVLMVCSSHVVHDHTVFFSNFVMGGSCSLSCETDVTFGAIVDDNHGDGRE
ncbi:hypothetical protein BDN71DRAFT_1429528 [Pleurotus eryngii]|uniref:Uncharacterized protein n=1 Tax=Pleurotus eryngii TaxID=5323 RepID=A0A9P6A513_PLEER|nr:hypothetical protein BDN71DRAFT_1429528 [Pleurotus eryngii]